MGEGGCCALWVLCIVGEGGCCALWVLCSMGEGGCCAVWVRVGVVHYKIIYWTVSA